MSKTLITTHPTLVSRAKDLRIRSLAAVACIALLGITTALWLLATHPNVTTARDTGASPITAAQTADTGARLDHRGLKDAAWLSGLAEAGARLDHRGPSGSSAP